MLAPCADGIGGTGRFQRLRTRLQQESVETLEHSQEQEAKKKAEWYVGERLATWIAVLRACLAAADGSHWLTEFSSRPTRDSLLVDNSRAFPRRTIDEQK